MGTAIVFVVVGVVMLVFAYGLWQWQVDKSIRKNTPDIGENPKPPDRNLTTVEWMTALALGCNGVDTDTALRLAGIIRGEYGHLVPTEENLRALLAEVQQLRRPGWRGGMR